MTDTPKVCGTCGSDNPNNFNGPCGDLLLDGKCGNIDSFHSPQRTARGEQLGTSGYLQVIPEKPKPTLWRRGMAMTEPDTCPDCWRPVSDHALYKNGLCPVVVIRMDDTAHPPRFEARSDKPVPSETESALERARGEFRDLFTCAQDCCNTSDCQQCPFCNIERSAKTLIAAEREDAARKAVGGMHTKHCTCHQFNLGVGGPDGCDAHVAASEYSGYLRCGKSREKHGQLDDQRCVAAREQAVKEASDGK